VERLKTFKKEGFETNSIVANPMFEDVAHANFQFKKESPALTKLKLKQPISVVETGVLEPYATLFKKKIEVKKSAPVVKKPTEKQKTKTPEVVNNKG
jgi:hypothetical protein